MDSLTHKPKINKRKGQALLPIPKVKQFLRNIFTIPLYHIIMLFLSQFCLNFVSILSQNHLTSISLPSIRYNFSNISIKAELLRL